MRNHAFLIFLSAAVLAGAVFVYHGCENPSVGKDTTSLSERKSLSDLMKELRDKKKREAEDYVNGTWGDTEGDEAPEATPALAYNLNSAPGFWADRWKILKDAFTKWGNQ